MSLDARSKSQPGHTPEEGGECLSSLVVESRTTNRQAASPRNSLSQARKHDRLRRARGGVERRTGNPTPYLFWNMWR